MFLFAVVVEVIACYAVPRLSHHCCCLLLSSLPPVDCCFRGLPVLQAMVMPPLGYFFLSLSTTPLLLVDYGFVIFCFCCLVATMFCCPYSYTAFAASVTGPDWLIVAVLIFLFAIVVMVIACCTVLMLLPTAVACRQCCHHNWLIVPL